MSHEDIARRAGVARETVTKMLKGMERRGFVKTGYRSLKMAQMVGWPTFAVEHAVFGLTLGLAWSIVGAQAIAPDVAQPREQVLHRAA